MEKTGGNGNPVEAEEILPATGNGEHKKIFLHSTDLRCPEEFLPPTPEIGGVRGSRRQKIHYWDSNLGCANENVVLNRFFMFPTFSVSDLRFFLATPHPTQPYPQR